MTAEKGKRQHSLPDRQIARAFQFSASDLAANRNGFMTLSQAWRIPLQLRGFFHQIGEWSVLKNRMHSRRQSIETICGRVSLSYGQQQIQSFFHADFIEVYKMTINSEDFRLTLAQYQAIGERIAYRLYYYPDNKRILSLERAINGCSES